MWKYFPEASRPPTAPKLWSRTWGHHIPEARHPCVLACLQLPPAHWLGPQPDTGHRLPRRPMACRQAEEGTAQPPPLRPRDPSTQQPFHWHRGAGGCRVSLGSHTGSGGPAGKEGTNSDGTAGQHFWSVPAPPVSHGVSMRTSQKTEHLTGEQGRQATLPSVKFGLSLKKHPSTF